MERYDFRIPYLISQYRKGILTTEEQAELNAWISDNPTNEKLFKEILNISARKKYAELESIDRQLAWETLNQKIEERHQRSNTKRRALIASVAAACLLILTFSTTLYYLYRPQESNSNEFAGITPVSTRAILELSGGDRIILDGNEESFLFTDSLKGLSIHAGTLIHSTEAISPSTGYNTLIIPRGGEYSTLLSDSTKIILNSESELKYPVNFSNDIREVFLKGEAFFDINPNPDKPFIVHAENASIEVLGTIFNFSCYEDESNTTITLVKGSVKIKTKNATEILLPGNQFNMSNASGEYDIKEVNPHIYTSWTTEAFRFEAMPLETLMHKLEKWFNIEYEFMDESLKNKRYTGGFRKDSNVEHVLNTIGVFYNVIFKMHDNKVIIDSK